MDEKSAYMHMRGVILTGISSVFSEICDLFLIIKHLKYEFSKYLHMASKTFSFFFLVGHRLLTLYYVHFSPDDEMEQRRQSHFRSRRFLHHSVMFVICFAVD